MIQGKYSHWWCNRVELWVCLGYCIPYEEQQIVI